MCHSGQDFRLLMEVGMITWKLHLTRGTPHITNICKIRKHQKWRIVDPLGKKGYN